MTQNVHGKIQVHIVNSRVENKYTRYILFLSTKTDT